MQEEREQREQYMDSLEQQMEEQREQIQRTLDRMAEDSDRRRKALEKLRSAPFPASPIAPPSTFQMQHPGAGLPAISLSATVGEEPEIEISLT